MTMSEIPDDPFAHIEPEAMRYGFDGYGFNYIDNGAGSYWRTAASDGEPMYPRAALIQVRDEEAKRIAAWLRASEGLWEQDRRVLAERIEAGEHRRDGRYTAKNITRPVPDREHPDPMHADVECPDPHHPSSEFAI
jgi:hypothetical protein